MDWDAKFKSIVKGTEQQLTRINVRSYTVTLPCNMLSMAELPCSVLKFPLLRPALNPIPLP